MPYNKDADYQYHGFLDRNYSSFGLDWSGDGVTNVKRKTTTTTERSLTYRFYTHFHPYVKELISELIEKSVSGLQAADTEYTEGGLQNDPPKPVFYDEFFARYFPNGNFIPKKVEGSDRLLHPVKELDFSSSGAYSVYNWELFFHVPFTIATHLSKNHRYEEAMRWFHYIFDPGDDSDQSTPERFWKVKPFQKADVRQIEDLLVNLSSGADPELLRQTINSIEAWKNAPFRPHVIARYRSSAYMYKTIMAYLDNLIDWGDSLFRQDTAESINEATQLYVLAANILGEKPQAVPKKGSVKTQTYASLRKELDAFGNALKEVEVDIPFNLAPIPGESSNGEQKSSLRSIGTSLYFSIPRNNKLLGYWDMVADRLYKIHNSLNLKGVFRQLPLFEPPIDPALLARAAAAGVDAGAIISGLNQPLPLIRFRLIIQKAMEVCQEVKALEGQLLSTIEKEDGEALSLLRSKHESKLQQLTEGVRYAQWQEAIKTREGLEGSLKTNVLRYAYYENLLGNRDPEVPEPVALDESAMEKKKFNSNEPGLEPKEVEYDFFAEALDAAGLGDLNSLRMNTAEAIAILLEAGTIPLEARAIGLDLAGGVLTAIPEIAALVSPIGVGGGVSIDGKQLGQIMQMMGGGIRGAESIMRTGAGISSTVAGYQRRRQGWESQSQQIAQEINNTYKQVVAAQIREFVAKKEYENHKIQLQNSQEIESFLNGEKVNNHKKASTKDFYSYLRREVKSLHSKYFKFAYDVGKKAERALQHELGKPELEFLKFDYLAGKESLFAGEKLAFDLKQMEMAYHDMNRRELELTKHISLMQLSPLSLLQLQLTGSCTIALPEEILDMGGCEGHYFRRIKSVALSIPCVAGPYTDVNATLTLTKSSIRKKSNLLGGEYARQENDTDRFSDFRGATSIVTSSAQNDRGMFEFNMHDERYLPFEYQGVISEWRLELAERFRQFDYKTITDVIFQINYTARQGGGLLKQGAIANLETKMKEKGNTRMFSLKHSFPSEWHKFLSESADDNGRLPLTFELKKEHYPYWSQGVINAIEGIEIHAIVDGGITVSDPSDGTKVFDLVKNESMGDDTYSGNWENIPLPAPTGAVSLMLSNKKIEDMWIVLRWVSS